jgi:hypothetical protein
VYYGALHLLLAAYVALVIVFVRRLFPASGLAAALAAALAALAALLFERVPEYWLYSGLVTNLVSGVAGVAALLLLDADLPTRRGRLAAAAAGVALFAASLFAKEDFAIAVVLAFALQTLERRLAGGRQRRRRDAVLLAALVLVSVAFLAWSLDGTRATFLRGAGETYRPDFSVRSLLPTTAWYLTCTPGTRIATGVLLVLPVLLALAGERRFALRAAAIVPVTLALVAPYAALPHHLFAFYAFNWTVWQSAALLAVGPLLASLGRGGRVALGSGLVVLLAAWTAVTQPQRSGTARWYAGEANRNRAILRTLDGLRETLRPWPVVGVTGLAPLNPWHRNDGAYLRNRLGFRNRWVVFADRDTLERTRTLLRSPRMGSIEVRDVADLHESGLPVIRFAPDGSGALALPEVPRLEAASGAERGR